MPKIGVLILAAGASTRMGRHKQLLPWNKTTLLGHAIETARKISDTVLVVLGSKAAVIKKEVPVFANYAINKAWEDGMGTSIALGVTELERMVNPDAIMVLLVDQPLIDALYLGQLLEAHAVSENKIIATSYNGRAGVPALFPKTYFESLKTLKNDVGAKHLMQHCHNRLMVLDAKDKIIDIDTPKAYDSLKKTKDRFDK
jgi:molybdenum cofactor cytidylyltransferase